MNIKEMITSNKPYISKHEDMDPTLKTKAKNLLWEFNNSKPDEDKKRSDILQELFGTCSPLTLLNHLSNVITGLIFIQKDLLSSITTV